MMNRLFLILILTFSSLPVQIQGPGFTDTAFLTSQPVAMAQEKSPGPEKTTTQDLHQEERSVLYTVMIVVLIIWAGISLYLYRIDKKISRIEKDMN